MAYEKKPVVKLTTPPVAFIWPKLTTPDYGSREFPKPDGSYEVRAQFDTNDPAHATFLAKVEKLQEAAIANACEEFKGLKIDKRKALEAKNPVHDGLDVNPPWKIIYDEETEEETGMVEMKFAMKASGVVKNGPRKGKKWNRKPLIFDAAAQPMKNVPDIWGGTIGRIRFEVQEGGYFIPGTGLTGIKRDLAAVQIIDLKSGSDKDAGDFGFDAEEGGYVHDDSATVTKDDADDDEFRNEGADHVEGADETADF